MDQQPILLGIDLGTSGVRAIAVTADGRVAARGGVPLPPSAPRGSAEPAAEGREQSPEAWWAATCRAVSAVVAGLRDAGFALEQLRGVCVDGTSGTLVPVDKAGHPTRPAILYNDPRAASEAEELNQSAAAFSARLGYRFDSSFTLPKILWLARHEPGAWERTAHCLHQADYIVSRLTGDVGATDYGNALKTGYDLLDERWPAWLDRWPPIAERLPSVVPPATPIGCVSALAAATGLPAGVTVLAGATDGVSASLASGLAQAGDYNTTLGTTLVFKGISRALVRHPQGIIYSHKLPNGMWLPGAASNTGGAWIDAWFAGADLPALDRAAQRHLPGHVVTYPLVGRGERFPFVAPEASGFVVPQPASAEEHYAACLVGTAFVERLAYEVLDAASGLLKKGDRHLALAKNTENSPRGSEPVPLYQQAASDTGGGAVFATGGAAASDVWMQCRADATGRVVHRPAVAESAFGSAVLAAAGTVHNGIAAAIQAMVRIERSFAPDASRAGAYDTLFATFHRELDKRGYLPHGRS